MLKIRLSRTGKKNAPAYRIVVMPEKHPRDGRTIEVLGHFNPSTKPPIFSLDKKRLKYWLSQGAQMTEAVKKLAKGKYEFKPYRPKAEEKEKEPKKEEKEVTKEIEETIEQSEIAEDVKQTRIRQRRTEAAKQTRTKATKAGTTEAKQKDEQLNN